MRPAGCCVLSILRCFGALRCAAFWYCAVSIQPGQIALARIAGPSLIASACVMTQLVLLKHAAALFNWSLDTATVDELIVKATEMNNAAAQADMESPNSRPSAE